MHQCASVVRRQYATSYGSSKLNQAGATGMDGYTPPRGERTNTPKQGAALSLKELHRMLLGLKQKPKLGGSGGTVVPVQ